VQTEEPFRAQQQLRTLGRDLRESMDASASQTTSLNCFAVLPFPVCRVTGGPFSGYFNLNPA
jgi:hypothetical protein